MEIQGLIAGLGNPGKEYEHTRHNFGFLAINALLEYCERNGTVRKLSGQKDPFELWRVYFGTAAIELPAPPAPIASVSDKEAAPSLQAPHPLAPQDQQKQAAKTRPASEKKSKAKQMRPDGEWLLLKPLTFMNRSGEAVQRVAAYYHMTAAQTLVLHDELDLPLGRMKMKLGGGSAGHNGLKSIQQMLGTPEFHRLRLGVGKPEGNNGASYVLGRFMAHEQTALADVLAATVTGIRLFIKEGERSAQQFCNGYRIDS